MADRQAIQQLKNGDLAGLEHLVLTHQVRAIRTAYLITHDRGLAEEVVQEAFLRLPTSIRTFDAARPFEPWFLRGVVNAAIRKMRPASRELPLEDPEAERSFLRLAAHLDSAHAQVEAAETADEVGQALERLSPRQRAVIVQRYYLDMSEAEMASTAGTSAGTIKWLLNAARARLRRALVERSDE